MHNSTSIAMAMAAWLQTSNPSPAGGRSPPPPYKTHNNNGSNNAAAAVWAAPTSAALLPSAASAPPRKYCPRTATALFTIQALPQSTI
eukprot:COSAG01_NODE_741_length_13888_cov_119.430996_5_plen_88_part_00